MDNKQLREDLKKIKPKSANRMLKKNGAEFLLGDLIDEEDFDQILSLFDSQLKAGKNKLLEELEGRAEIFTTEKWEGTSVILNSKIKAVPLSEIKKHLEGLK